MSKAEEKAQNRYPTLAETYAFIDGYEQAEEDLELTWEDMMAIDDLLDELLPPRRDSDELVLKGYYEELLKRFKNLKK